MKNQKKKSVKRDMIVWFDKYRSDQMNTEKLPKIKEYELVNFRPLLIRERHEIYVRLTKNQRKLIDEHRKYLIRSEFLRDSYLKTSDWEFQDLKIDSFYPHEHPNQKKLYCKCGRRLKYQYLIKSKETGETIGLGIQHFKDHLNIPQEVASEITDRLNNVDLGLDELLWLKRQGTEFPEELWVNYAYYLNSCQLSNKTYEVNVPLAQRFADFREAQMPIYLVDYKHILAEIEKMKSISNSVTTKSITDESFELFKNQLTDNLKVASLFHHALIWSSQIQKSISDKGVAPSLPSSFFDELLSLLMSDATLRERKIQQFSSKGMGKWIQKEVYHHLLQKSFQYGISDPFFNEIHPFMRNGLKKSLIKLKNSQTNMIEMKVKSISELLNDLDKETQLQILETLNNRMNKDK